MVNEATQVAAFVRRRISWFSESNNESFASAALAKLRRGIGKSPGAIPEIWDLTLDGLPEAFLSRDGIPTKGEWAIHTALTLYALHQQGKNPNYEIMNRDGVKLGNAVRALVKSDEDETRVKRRFDAVATSNSFEELTHHLRGLVQLLKVGGIPLDYSNLSEDLYFFQVPERRDSVRLKWGQDYYSSKSRKEEENDE